MSSLFIDRRNVEMRLDGGAIVFCEEGVRTGTVPVAPVDRVFVRSGVTVTTDVLGRLGEEGIGLVVLHGRKDEPVLFMPPMHNDAERRVAQHVLSLDEEFCRLAAFDIVRKKLHASADLLDKLALERNLRDSLFSERKEALWKDLERLDVKDTLDSIRGIEGHAATCHFGALERILPPALNFHGRNRRPPRDPFNATISLSYTLLLSETILALHGAGLDPHVGFFHKLAFGRPSLACDLMEPLRPLVDEFAIKTFEERILRPEDFSATEKGCFMGKAARARYYPAYEAQAKPWRKTLEANARDLASGIVAAFRRRHPGAAAFREPEATVQEADCPLAGKEAA